MHIAECWDISEKLLIGAMARCRLNDLVFKKASQAKSDARHARDSPLWGKPVTRSCSVNAINRERRSVNELDP
jgi:hypothetical protein